jgi:hypothetical protein
VNQAELLEGSSVKRNLLYLFSRVSFLLDAALAVQKHVYAPGQGHSEASACIQNGLTAFQEKIDLTSGLTNHAASH